MQGAISVGVLMASNTYVRRVYWPLRDLSQIYTTYQAAAASLDRIDTFLSRPTEVVYPPRSETAIGDPYAAAIEIERLSFAYNDEPILESLDWRINRGDRVGVIGESGVGKSTLIKLLGRLYDPQEGAIRLNGIDIRLLPEQQLRDTVQIVSQETFLFPTSVWRNIAYGLPNVKREDIVNVVQHMGLTSFFKRLDKGLDTMIGEGGNTLSGGQRQAVALARAFLRKPPILVLDEAASNLDPQIESILYEQLQSMLQGKTLIVVTHRVTSLKLVDIVFEMDHGNIVEVDKEKVMLAGWNSETSANAK